MVVSLPTKLRWVRNVIPKDWVISSWTYTPHSPTIHCYTTTTPEQQTTHDVYIHHKRAALLVVHRSLRYVLRSSLVSQTTWNIGISISGTATDRPRTKKTPSLMLRARPQLRRSAGPKRKSPSPTRKKPGRFLTMQPLRRLRALTSRNAFPLKIDQDENVFVQNFVLVWKRALAVRKQDLGGR